MRKRRLAKLLCCVMIISTVLSNMVFTGAAEKKYLALGDSIARGYGLENIESERYSTLVAEKMGYVCQNYGVDGMTSAELLENIKKDNYSVDTAEVITISIGSNDLLQPLIGIVAGAMNIDTENTVNIEQAIADTLINDYNTDELLAVSKLTKTKEALTDNAILKAAAEQAVENINSIVSEIRLQNESCEIYLSNIYNPYYGVSVEKDYGSFVYTVLNLGQLGDEYVSIINNGLKDSANCEIVDVYSEFNTKGMTNVYLDVNDINSVNIDPHPNKEGHYLIYNAMIKAMSDTDIGDGTTETTTEITTEAVTTDVTTEVTTVSIVYGDVNGSGLLEADDAALVMQYVLNASAVNMDSVRFKRADVNNDGILTADDAAMIMQKVLNGSYMLPVEIVSNTTTETTSETTTEIITETSTVTATLETSTNATTLETSTETTTNAELNRDMYSLTGFGASNTGGGVIPETDSKYAKVSTAKEFDTAISNAKKGSVKVIEITADLNLGSKEIKAHSTQPSMHPRLKKTGISSVNLGGIDGLTIYSKNGAVIRHGAFSIQDTDNLIIRNLEFDELWEWDESTKALYKKNDWDYMTIASCTNVWIDHCTFHKSYDGVIDAKRNVSGLTISWCYFPEDDYGEGSFLKEQIDFLEENINSYSYYKKVRQTYGFTKEEIMRQCAGHDKTHLLGSSEMDSNNKNLNVTMYNNYYKNCQQRMPRLRSGNVHVFNTVIDSGENYVFKNLLADKFALVNLSSEGFHIVSDGCVSTEDGALLVENSNFIGVEDPLCNNKKGATKTDYTGKIKADNVLYELGNVTYMGSSEDDNSPIEIGPAKKKEFSWNGINQLPYTYVKLNPEILKELLLGNNGCGSGKGSLSGNQWLETKYK